MLHSARGRAAARHSARRALQWERRAQRSAPRRRVWQAQYLDGPAVPRGPQAAYPQRAAWRRQEAAWSLRQAGPAEWSEMEFRPPAALRVSALPQAQAVWAPARRVVQPRAAWRRRAAVPFAHRAAAASEWPELWAPLAQRVALPRMVPRAAASAPAVPRLVARCVPAAQQLGVWAVAYVQAEPPLVASAHAARLPEAALDAPAERRLEVAASAVSEQPPEAAVLAAREPQREAVVLAVRVQQPEAVVLDAPAQQQAARRDVRAELRRERQGAAAVQAVSAHPPAAPPSVAASAVPLGRLRPSSRLVPRRAARFAHAMRS